MTSWAPAITPSDPDVNHPVPASIVALTLTTQSGRPAKAART